jgi:ABC-type antimicrobial peptide transport system permease subunit
MGFNSIIFNVGGVLLLSNIKWWYYVIGVVSVMGLLTISGFLGYYQLTKESLVERLKTV